MNYADRVKDTTTSVGTGTLTVSGTAPVGFRSLSSAFSVGASNIPLCFVLGAEWEVSLCTLVTSTTVSRDTVLASSNGGALVNFSAGTKDLFCTMSATQAKSFVTTGINPLDRLSTGKMQMAWLPGGDYMQPFPNPGSAVVLLELAAGNSGTVSRIQMSTGNGTGALSFDGLLRIFVDQETVPSFVADLGTLFASHADAHTDGVAKTLATDHISTGIMAAQPNATGVSSLDDMVSYELLLPVPYSNGIRIEVYNPTATVPTGMFFSMVTRRDDLKSPYRLRTVSKTRLEAVAGAAHAGASDIQFFDLQNVSGWLVLVGISVFGATNYSYMERPWFFYVDGEATPSFIGDGGEDFFGALGWYFLGRSIVNTENAIITHAANANKTFGGILDLLKMHGGIRFGNRLNAKWTNKATYVSSTTHKNSYVFAYYADTSVPFVPPQMAAPTVSQASATSANVAWVPTASSGSSFITGYTVTATPGGATAAAAATATSLVFTGLTTGTAYTFTVKAANSVGAGVNSSASSSITLTAPTVPGTPTIGTATAGNAQATVTFTAPASNGGSAITGYTATSSPGGFTGSITGATAAPITVAGLTNATAYTFTVHATNAIGNSLESAASNSVTPSSSIINITDDFNRANATTLGTTPVGAKTWTTISAVTAEVGIDTNTAYVRSVGSGTTIAYIDAGVANTDTSVTISTLGTTPVYSGLATRIVDINNFVLLQYDAETSGGTRYALYRKNAGAFTLLGGSTGITPASGDVLRLVANGTNYTFYVNATAFGPFADTTSSTTSTLTGLQASSTATNVSNTRYDNFAVTNA